MVTYQDLIEKVLDELLFQRSRGQETMKIGAQELGHEITGRWKIPHISLATKENSLDSVSYMSSNGEIKMSLKLITFIRVSSFSSKVGGALYVFMAQVLQQLEFSIGALREHRSAERFHDLFDRHGLAGQLVLCRATRAAISMIFGGLVQAN